MPEQPASERTLPPTARKLFKARARGSVPQSQEFSSVVVLAGFVAVTAFLAPWMKRFFISQISRGLSGRHEVFADSRTFIEFANGIIVESMVALLPFFAVLLIAGIVGHISISGWNFSLSTLTLKFNFLNPAGGLARLFNARALVGLSASVAKLLFICLIVWFYISDKLEALMSLRWVWSGQILAALGQIILGLMIRVCIALLVIGLADAFYQKWKYIEELKMTRQEVREEHRDLEGAPEVKARIHKAQLQMAMKRMLKDVPKASVVLVNPTHFAVALKYDAKTMPAPVLVAKGADHLAAKIQEIARAYGVPILRRPELTRTIYSTVDVGEQIPAELYVAVAEILALIYRLRHRK